MIQELPRCTSVLSESSRSRIVYIGKFTDSPSDSLEGAHAYAINTRPSFLPVPRLVLYDLHIHREPTVTLYGGGAV